MDGFIGMAGIIRITGGTTGIGTITGSIQTVDTIPGTTTIITASGTMANIIPITMVF
jgi:hypothetical protein